MRYDENLTKGIIMKIAIFVCTKHEKLITKLNNNVAPLQIYYVNPSYYIWDGVNGVGFFMERLPFLEAFTILEDPSLIYNVK
jgi:hypothetical protein